MNSDVDDDEEWPGLRSALVWAVPVYYFVPWLPEMGAGGCVMSLVQGESLGVSHQIAERDFLILASAKTFHGQRYQSERDYERETVLWCIQAQPYEVR